jgi:tRNA-2-methylthio-N6-dimethylallyladenosine synthase
MKRRYTREHYLQIIKKLRLHCPDVHISSDFIVGFPGETEEDFQGTMDLIDEVGFDQSFSFLYSSRPGTPAAELPDNTPMEVKKERLQQLQAKINGLSAAISASMVSTNQEVLVEGISKRRPEEMSGRTENNRVVNFSGPKSWIGQFVNVHITSAMPNSLRGVPLEAHTPENRPA